MKKVAELVLFTLFFFSLTGLGLTAGLFAWIGVLVWLREVIG
jgi:hypothetical protein